MTDRLEVARTAVVIALEVTEREHTDPVFKALDQFRIDKGEAQRREAIVSFAEASEEFLNSLSEDERTELYEAMAWDWEWLPSIMNQLQAEGSIDWFHADVKQIAEANKIVQQEG